MLLGMIILLPGASDEQKPPVLGMILVCQRSPRYLQNTHAIDLTLIYFSEFKGTYLLLKIPYTTDIGIGLIKLELTLKPSP